MAGFFNKVQAAAVDEDAVKQRADAAQADYVKKNGGAPADEENLEEGDISDYVLPFEGLGRNLLKAVAEKSVEAGGKAVGKAVLKEGVKDLKNEVVNDVKGAFKPEVPGPDYTNQNIAFRPTKPGKQEGWERFSFGKKQ